MKLGKNEYTTESFLNFLKENYKTKVTGKDFNASDIKQYLIRGMLPYRYGGNIISSKKENGVRIIVMKANGKK
jgi:hypothetical protein